MSKGIMGALSALFAASVCALSGTALAQDAAQERGELSVSADTSGVGHRHSGVVGPLRINAGLHLGLGGGARGEVEGLPGSSTADLAVTPGLQAGIDYVIMDYFSLGGETRLAWFNTKAGQDADISRTMLWDLDLKPKGRYAFSNIPLELYGTLPMGLSVIGGNDDVDTDATAGFNLGFGPGATYFITDRIGVNTEMLGIFRWFSETIDSPFGGGSTDVKTRLGQFTWFFNAVFAI